MDLAAFSRPRSSGLIAIELQGDNQLIGVAITDGNQDIMLFSNEGKAIRFHESDVRVVGRSAMGVRGMRIPDAARIVSLCVAPEDGEVLTACENGFGKRSLVSDFPHRLRGGQGVIAVQTSERNGELVGAVVVSDGNELLLISDMGTLVRTRVSEIRTMSRNTQGVMLIRLSDQEKLVGVVCLDEPEEEDEFLPGADAVEGEAAPTPEAADSTSGTVADTPDDTEEAP